MSPINYTTLAEALRDTPDPRNERGRSYKWEYLLSVIAAAMLTGEKTLKGISQWVIAQGQELKAILKPKKQRVPSLSIIRRTLCNLLVDELEGVLTRYQRMLEQESGDAGVIVTKQGEVLHGQLLDGKTVRGASAHGKLAHLNEDIEAAFAAPPPKGTCEQEFWDYASTTVQHHGHGCTDAYFVESTTVFNRYLEFPDIKQVIRRTRRLLDHHTKQLSVSVEYLITTLDRTRVSLEQVEQLRRWHWTIENVVHYLRDVGFGEAIVGAHCKQHCI